MSIKSGSDLTYGSLGPLEFIIIIIVIYFIQ